MATNRAPINRPDLAERFAWQKSKDQALFSAAEAPTADAVLEKYARQQSRCRSMVTRALNSSPLLQFLTKSIEERKCELSKPVALCVPMPDAKVEAAYHVGRRQVVVNSLVVSTQQDAIRLLLHELTHAYDACRVYLDPSDCRHAACTEVRASNLSTECNWRHEWFGTNRRPHLGLQAQQKACVQRRATASIQGVPGCAGKDCEEVVKSVFERCYADTSPFPRTPI